MYLRKLLILLTVFFTSFYTQAQLTVTSASGMSPQQLVQNILVGTGVTIDSVKFNGSSAAISSNQIGSFTGGNSTNLGFTNGLILSSGGVSGAIGPNNSASSTVSITGTSISDPQLQAIASGVVNDAAVLEFNFIPLSDTIKFRYVFASEEYPEYVCSNFNDIFGFFISGLNPLGSNYVNKNIAIIPGTALPVTINALNTGVVGQYGISSNCTSLAYSSYYIDNTNGITIQYDGFTTILTAWALVMPCNSYHIKLAVADCVDYSYDSGVFLEANSFSSPPMAIHKTLTNPTASNQNAIEGCSNMVLTFKAPHVVSNSLTIPIISTGGTASSSDYTLSPPTLVIPAGSDSVKLTISPVFDHITEGTETLTLVFQTADCGHMYDTVTFNILDYDSLTAVAYGDTTLCNNQTTLSVIAHNGVPPYQYSWSNAAGNTAMVTPTFLSTTNYKITVTDACFKTAVDSALVVVDCHFARAGSDTTICLGGTATLHASGGSVYLWNTGDPTPILSVSPTVTTTYVVTVTNVFSDIDSVTVFVNPLPLVTATSVASTICYGDSTLLQASGANTYLWTANISDVSLNGQQTQASPIVSPKTTTIYTVNGSDLNTCSNTAFVTVNVSPQPKPKVVVSPNPVSVYEPTVHIYDGSGETNNYVWFLGDNTTTTQNNFYHTYSDKDTGSYLINVIATNIHGCIDSASLWVIVQPDVTFYIPNSFSPNNDGVNDVFKVYGMGIESFEMSIYDRWGKIVYTSEDMNAGWDGKINNELAPDGTYAYVIIYKDNSSIKHSKSGAISIVRK
ncbi:MAG: gliding motility-associated C-terminal domain-containing protein [Bacteroidetes bacterium]|nr:gliding motility-associated C-terminal domain-containing protein [Bacteroidota bacterium]